MVVQDDPAIKTMVGHDFQGFLVRLGLWNETEASGVHPPTTSGDLPGCRTAQRSRPRRAHRRVRPRARGLLRVDR